MTKTNRLLALLLSLIMVFGVAVFTANAENTASPVELSADTASAETVVTDTRYIATAPGGRAYYEGRYVRFSTGDANGYYYTLTAKNENELSENGEIVLWVTDSDGSHSLADMSLLAGEEKSLTLRLDGKTDYALNILNRAEGSEYKDGTVTFTLTSTPDPEPNEKSSKVLVPSNEFYEGNLANADDEDWICLSEYDQKKYRVLLESREEGQELQAMVYTYSSYKETIDLICGETADAAVISTSGKNERYYVRVAGIEGSFGDYAIRFEEFSTVTPENDRTLNSVKFINCYNGTYDYHMMQIAEFGRNYVTFVDDNTWVKDARHIIVKTEGDDCEYELWAKNEDMPTDKGLCVVEIVENRSTGEPVITQMCLAMGEENSTTIKLEPYEYYYLKFYTLDEDTRPGGTVKFKVSKVTEPEVTETTTVTEATEATEATDTTVITEVATTSVTEPEKPATTVVTEATEASTNAMTTDVSEPEETTVSTTAAVTEETTETTVITAENTTETASEPSKQYMLGDTDLNGKINIKDATLIQKAAAKITALEGNELITANVNSDSKVNVKDATAIQKYLAKIETPYSIGEYII